MINAITTHKPPIIMCTVKGSPNPIIEKIVENKGTKNRKLLEIVAPRKFKLVNHNPNDPIDAGNTSHQNHNHPQPFNCPM